MPTSSSTAKSHKSPTPSRFTSNRIQSPYFCRASGLLQIAVYAQAASEHENFSSRSTADTALKSRQESILVGTGLSQKHVYGIENERINLVQLRVFSTGLLEAWYVRISPVPQCEEILVGKFPSCRVS